MNDRESIVNEIIQRRIGAIIRTEDQQLAADAMQAAVDGGFQTVEFTLTTPGALELISSFAQQSSLLVGAGTVLTMEQAQAAVDAGARFLVSPICDTNLIVKLRALDVALIPGTFTATEMEAAHRAGADFCKLFPAPADLPGTIAAILGPLPHLRIYPTNGVTLENVLEVLGAGAAGVGFVKALFDPVWLADKDFAAIKTRAAEIAERVAGAS